MLDLLKTGKYGLLAQQKLLATTSNNIANVNTVGYVRQQTNVYTSVIDWGIGATHTRRMYDQYVQRELLRDQGNVAYHDSYMSGMGVVDEMLSSDDMNISSSLNSYFEALQDAVQNPTSTANRKELLAQLGIMVDRYHTLNHNMTNQLHDVNNKIKDSVVEVNALVSGLHDVMKQLKMLSDDQSDMAMQLLDKRDQMINELSTFIDISTTVEDDGSISVYMGNGQLLCNGETYAQLDASFDELDPTRCNVSIRFSNDRYQTEIAVSNEQWGGKIGGLLKSTDEIRNALRELGQLSVAFADAMNERNKAGITLEGVAGDNMITIPSAKGITTTPGLAMTATFRPGEGMNVPPNDFKVIFDKNGNPTVYMVEANGDLTKVDATVGTDAKGNLQLTLDDYGMDLTFNVPPGDARLSDSKALVQPTMHAAYDIQLAITKPEDFAFASSVTVATGANNGGNATISMVGVNNTGPDMGVSIGADGKPVFNAGAPTQIKVNDDGDYEVYDSTGKLLGTAPASCDGQNLFSNVKWVDAKPAGYPGYEVNVTGTIKPGDTFNMMVNTDGKADNSNGVIMGQLQQEGMVYSSKNNKNTFTEDYADLLTTVGSNVLEAQTNYTASATKCNQTLELYYNAAGVNLDEEAASLIRFQQSYAACSKIINASQTIFDALISAI